MGLSTIQDPYQEDAVLNAILEEDVEDDFGDDADDDSAEEGREAMEIDDGEFCREEATEISATPEMMHAPQQPKSTATRCKRKRQRGIDVARFVQDTCEKLEEPKKGLIWNAVHKLGLEAFRGLLVEVDAIEACGGQMTSDGKRRRSSGGVLWNIVKARVSPDLYKAIMNFDKTNQKKKDKERRKKKQRKVQQQVSVITPLPPVSQGGDSVRAEASTASPSTHPPGHAPVPALPKAPLALKAPKAPLALKAPKGRADELLNVDSEGTKSRVSTSAEGVGGGASEGLDAALNRKLTPGVVAGWRHSWALGLAPEAAAASDEVEKTESELGQDSMEGVQTQAGEGEGGGGGGGGGREAMDGKGMEGKRGVGGGVEGQYPQKSSIAERLRFPVIYEGVVEGVEADDDPS